MLESFLSYLLLGAGILFVFLFSQIIYLSIYQLRKKNLFNPGKIQSLSWILLLVAGIFLTLASAVFLYLITDSYQSIVSAAGMALLSFIVQGTYRLAKDLRTESQYGDRKNFFSRIGHNIKQMIAIGGMAAAIISTAMLGMNYISSAVNDAEKVGLKGLGSLQSLFNSELLSDEVIVVKVIDGDTIKVKKNGDEINVRLIGIDTPEQTKNSKAWRDSRIQNLDIEKMITMGKQSTQFVQSVVKPGDKLRLELDTEENDDYGRLLGYLWISDTLMLNNLILSEGYAVPMKIAPNTKYSENFTQSYQSAIRLRLGLWK